MQLFLKTVVSLVGHTCWFDVFKISDNEYLAKETRYSGTNYYDKGPGEIKLTKVGKKWEFTKDGLLNKQYSDSIIEEIEREEFEVRFKNRP